MPEAGFYPGTRYPNSAAQQHCPKPCRKAAINDLIQHNLYYTICTNHDEVIVQ